MASVVEVMFLLSFLVFIGLWFLKLYNVVTGMDKLSNGVNWLVTIGLFMSFGVGFVTFLTGEYTIFYASLFEFVTWLFYLVWLFVVIELLVYLARKSTGERKAYNSLEDK